MHSFLTNAAGLTKVRFHGGFVWPKEGCYIWKKRLRNAYKERRDTDIWPAAKRVTYDTIHNKIISALGLPIFQIYTPFLRTHTSRGNMRYRARFWSEIYDKPRFNDIDSNCSFCSLWDLDVGSLLTREETFISRLETSYSKVLKRWTFPAERSSFKHKLYLGKCYSFLLCISNSSHNRFTLTDGAFSLKRPFRIHVPIIRVSPFIRFIFH